MEDKIVFTFKEKTIHNPAITLDAGDIQGYVIEFKKLKKGRVLATIDLVGEMSELIGQEAKVIIPKKRWEEEIFPMLDDEVVEVWGND